MDLRKLPKERNKNRHCKPLENPRPQTSSAIVSANLPKSIAGEGRRRLKNFPKALRTHILRHLGQKTILHKAFGLF